MEIVKRDTLYILVNEVYDRYVTSEILCLPGSSISLSATNLDLERELRPSWIMSMICLESTNRIDTPSNCWEICLPFKEIDDWICISTVLYAMPVCKETIEDSKYLALHLPWKERHFLRRFLEKYRFPDSIITNILFEIGSINRPFSTRSHKEIFFLFWHVVNNVTP